MTSSSLRGSSSITLQFALDRNIDMAAQEVQAAIAAVARRLPPSMPAPPTVQKVNPTDQPILFMSMNSRALSPQVLNKYAETIIAPRISSVEGVAQVEMVAL